MTERATFLAGDADVPDLRAAVANITRGGYSETAVRDRLGLRDLTELHWRNLPMYRDERLAQRDILDLAIDLFLLQGALRRAEVQELLNPTDLNILVRTGLLTIDETGAALARASLFPVGDRLVFSDHAWPELPHPGYATVPYDQIMWIGLDSRHLARCTSRRHFHSALDLCTGSGIHALLAAAHTSRVTAVDINPRAVCCTRFNAQAAGIDNLKAVEGDLFEPVQGETFDLITANPPFVPSPVDALGFRDGGRSGEDIQKRIVAGLARHLAPGGVAHIITELGERDNEPLALRLRGWLDGAPMDIHILRLGEHAASKYAIGHANGDDYAAMLKNIRAWAANLRDQGYLRVVSVLISIEWSDGPASLPWERCDESPPPLRAAGEEIEAIFSAERMTRDPALSLENACVRRAGPVALLDAQVLGGDLRAKTKATLLGQGLSIEHQLDPFEREILLSLEGTVAVRQLLETARQLNISEASILEATRSLLRRRLASLA